MIGLELSLGRLWAMRRLVFGMGSAQIILTGLIIGSIAWAFGNTVEASVVLGSCLALSFHGGSHAAAHRAGPFRHHGRAR